MKRRIERAKRLLKVQSRLLLTERLELETLKEVLAHARQEEQKAIALLAREDPPPVPPALLAQRAAALALRIKHAEALLKAQVEKTLDHARREQLVKKKLDMETEIFFRKQMQMSLQATIDAYLRSSLKQDE